MSRALVLVVVFALAAAGLTLSVHAKEPETLPVLRRKLLEAQGDQRMAAALDRLTDRIGVAGFFADHGAFGDWLGQLPDGRADHELVKVRRGWAYVSAKRGAEAVPLLEAAVASTPGDGLRRAYLGEALRQAKRYTEAAEMLTAAVRCGHYGTHVRDSLVKTLFDVRRKTISGHADDLPEYMNLARTYLGVRPDPDIDFTIAQLLLEDFKTYEKPDRTRGKLWARVAGEHALSALTGMVEVQAGSAQLAFDAALALESVDAEEHGATDRWDLLVHAWQHGRDPNGGPPLLPQAIVHLAELAAREGRFALAHRLAARRLEISNSPRARRLLMRLPPDLGQDE